MQTAEQTEMETDAGEQEGTNTQTGQRVHMKCDMCEVTCPSEVMYNQHLKGSKHQKKLKRKEVERLWAEKDPSVYCSICDLALEPALMENHLTGLKHRATAERKCGEEGQRQAPVTDNQPLMDSVSQSDSPSTSSVSEIKCELCGVTLTDIPVANSHFNSQHHIIKCMEKYFEAKKAAERNSENSFYCEICDITVIGQVTYDSHVQGFKHNYKVTDGNFDADSPFAAKSMKIKEKLEKRKELQLAKKMKMKERRKKMKELNKAKKLQMDVDQQEALTDSTHDVEQHQDT